MIAKFNLPEKIAIAQVAIFLIENSFTRKFYWNKIISKMKKNCFMWKDKSSIKKVNLLHVKGNRYSITEKIGRYNTQNELTI